MLKNFLAVSSIAIASLVGGTASASPVPATDSVDTILSLVIDVSGSVSTSEYNLQMGGYAAAFNDVDIQNAILNGTLGKIAVNVVQFASTASERVQFQILDDATSISAFATTLGALTRFASSSTSIASGITTGAATIESWLTAGNTATRAVIDVSGDGQNNFGGSVTAARDAALAGNIDAINGISIGGGSTLLDYYKDNVIGGTDSFAIGAVDFAAFSAGVKTKLKAEITGTPPGGVVPVPAALPLLAGGLALLGFVGRRRRKTT
ncbi:hypothetical protein C1J05_08635 [Sulfitobacter sp. JL08]|nr:hypothetical protein C1J05_08635 [Sulfitobacter sp. JL08]